MLDTKSENEAFGIFLRITNRKIRILPEGTLVARRVGGLEELWSLRCRFGLTQLPAVQAAWFQSFPFPSQ